MRTPHWGGGEGEGDGRRWGVCVEGEGVSSLKLFPAPLHTLTPAPVYACTLHQQAHCACRARVQRARAVAPCVVFVDELDALGLRRAEGGERSTRWHDTALWDAPLNHFCFCAFILCIHSVHGPWGTLGGFVDEHWTCLCTLLQSTDV